VWFTACWMFASDKGGISASGVQRALEIGLPDRVDDAAPAALGPGPPRPGATDRDGGGGRDLHRRRRARAARRPSPGQEGPDLHRCRDPRAERTGAGAGWRPWRMRPRRSLHAFVTDHVEPGATVITDAWQGYRGLDRLGYVHDRRNQCAARARGQDPGELLPAVHRVASLIKRWLLGTHQGSTDVAHLPAYISVTWNLAARRAACADRLPGSVPASRWGGLRAGGDGRAEVAGVGAACARGRVAADLGRSGPRASHDRGVRAWTGRVPAGLRTRGH
ncbi:MAG: hypothetical protein GEV09_25170, partial [Pseudonocardiaceae bacterium]|nr:hypothetical protein [Pseudonocardiaceae bacterium]